MLWQIEKEEQENTLLDEQSVAFSVSMKDLNLWIKEPMPVFIIVYDAIQKVAYWLYVQAYFEENKQKIDLTQKSITLYFSINRDFE
jgi:hypothetical protein